RRRGRLQLVLTRRGSKATATALTGSPQSSGRDATSAVSGRTHPFRCGLTVRLHERGGAERAAASGNWHLAQALRAFFRGRIGWHLAAVSSRHDRVHGHYDKEID